MANILNEKEETFVNYLRNPMYYVARKSNPKMLEMKDFTTDEIITLNEKMDNYTIEVGEIYRSLGIYDEMYILEISHIKDILKEELNRRKDRFSQEDKPQNNSKYHGIGGKENK